MIAEKGKVILCPGVQDGISARVAIRNGVDAMFMVCRNPSCYLLASLRFSNKS